MSWAELGWPDLSPSLPEPHPLAPPPRPLAPVDIAARVRRAERRRGVFVPLCALAGALLFGGGLAIYRVSDAGAGAGVTHSYAALALMGIGLLVAFVVPALAVLLVIGPHWRQRTQHMRVIQWQRDCERWRLRERERYIAALSPTHRAALQRALAGDDRQQAGRGMFLA